MAQSKYFTNVEPRFKDIEAWAEKGLSDRQIAENLGIAYSTFREYKKKFPALSALLKKGKDCAIKQVENALFKKAIGYTYKEKIRELRMNEETGKEELVVVKEVNKNVPADLGAMIFILKNKKPEEWQDNPHKVKYDREALELRKKEIEAKMF